MGQARRKTGRVLERPEPPPQPKAREVKHRPVPQEAEMRLDQALRYLVKSGELTAP